MERLRDLIAWSSARSRGGRPRGGRSTASGTSGASGARPQGPFPLSLGPLRGSCDWCRCHCLKDLGDDRRE